MRVISHRGNLTGPGSQEENTAKAVEKALGLGFDVEIDLWLTGYEEWKLGHDFGLELISFSWLIERREKLWIHCKNLDALDSLSVSSNDLNFFWHESDSFTLTSRGFVWAYPSSFVFTNFVNVLPEKNNLGIDQMKNRAWGVCTDYPMSYQK